MPTKINAVSTFVRFWHIVKHIVRHASSYTITFTYNICPSITILSSPSWIWTFSDIQLPTVTVHIHTCMHFIDCRDFQFIEHYKSDLFLNCNCLHMTLASLLSNPVAHMLLRTTGQVNMTKPSVLWPAQSTIKTVFLLNPHLPLIITCCIRWYCCFIAI